MSFVTRHSSLVIRHSLFLVTVILLLIFLPTPIFAAPPTPTTPQLIEAAFERGDISRDTANLYLAYALFSPENLPSAYQSDTPWHATSVLLQLQESLPEMNSITGKNQITNLLSGSCSGSYTTLPNVFTSTHFYIEYDTISGGLTVNDYANALETTWNTEVTDFAWAAPPVYTPNPAPDNLYHVRIDPSIPSNYYGYVSNYGDHAGYIGDNPATAWNDSDAYASCMVLNADYSNFPGTPTTAMQATMAHEFNHSIQYGLGALSGGNIPDNVFIEGGATWMEDEVFDSSNDNYNYLYPQFNMCMGKYDDFPYSYWVVFRAMTEPFGTGVANRGENIMQDFWEQTSQNTANNLSAMNAGFAAKGTSLAEAYHNAAIALKFNHPCGGGYVHPYCLEEGADYMNAKGGTTVQRTISAVGDSVSGTVADNYALNWIRLPITDTAYYVSLQNTSGGGQLRASLVCDTGSALRVFSLPEIVGAGQNTTFANFQSAGCTEAVAIITNQSQTAANPSACTNRSYILSTTTHPEPTFAPLPDQSLWGAAPLPQAIDLWNYAGDDLDTPNIMTYTIINSPVISAGVSITANRYIAIEPYSGQYLRPGWHGTTTVDLQVQDTEGLTATTTFNIPVTEIFKTLLFPIFKNYTFP